MNFDQTKLIYHPERVSQWRMTGRAFPIYMEVSPTNVCNHKCCFCAMDFARGNKYLDVEKYSKFIEASAMLGLKSVMFGGEGEPLLHPNIVELIRITKEAGLDVALTTNGSKLDEKMVLKILPYLSWIKVSLDAGSLNTYEKIHGVGTNEHSYVAYNIRNAMFIRNDTFSKCRIGVQATVLEENENLLEMLLLASFGRFLGVDYLVLKPYSQHAKSGKKKSVVKLLSETVDQMRLHETEGYKIIYREKAFDRVGKEKSYSRCHALPFWAFLDSEGNTWSCSSHLGNGLFLRGKGYKWYLDTSLPLINTSCKECRENCRMDSTNEYLEKLLCGENNFL